MIACDFWATTRILIDWIDQITTQYASNMNAFCACVCVCVWAWARVTRTSAYWTTFKDVYKFMLLNHMLISSLVHSRFVVFVVDVKLIGVLCCCRFFLHRFSSILFFWCWVKYSMILFEQLDCFGTVKFLFHYAKFSANYFLVMSSSMQYFSPAIIFFFILCIGSHKFLASIECVSVRVDHITLSVCTDG